VRRQSDKQRRRDNLLSDRFGMSTALFFQYIPPGFVIATDGRSTKEDTGEVANDSVQKLFQIGGPARRLAYAMTGALKLETPDGHVAVNIADEMTSTVDLLSKQKFSSLFAFVSQVCDPIYRTLRTANKAGLIAQLPSIPQPERHGEIGETIIRIVVAGYLDGKPASVEARIAHKDQVILKPRVENQRLDPTWTWRSGVPEVSARLLEQTDPTFATYRPFIPHNRNPTIAEVVEIARMYIAACGSPEALAINPAAAKGIGGRTLIATITPAAGFRWVEGCEPLLTNDEPTPPAPE
jgi:hypothetical protein